MQKKLLTAAIGAALMAGTSLIQANVKVGGMAQAELYTAETECSGIVANVGALVGSIPQNRLAPSALNGVCGKGNITGTNGLTENNAVNNVEETNVNDNARGRFWITADEELGGGYKGLAKFEFSADTADGGVADARNREKYVGLQGGVGTILVGNVHGVYKRLGGTSWDTFNATNLEARNNGGQSGGRFGHNAFIPGSIKYESPKFAGIQFQALYSPNGTVETVGGAEFKDQSNDWQAGLSWKGGPVELIAAYSKDENTGRLTDTTTIRANGTADRVRTRTTEDDLVSAKLGAKVVFAGHSLSLQAEKVESGATTFTATNDVALAAIANPGLPAAPAVTTTDYSWLHYAFKFGSNTIAASYGKASSDEAVETETTYYMLGYVYNFSKTFRTFAGYRSTQSEQGVATADTSVISFGMRKDF